MPYSPQTWTNDVSPLNATRLNYIEAGIVSATAGVYNVQDYGAVGDGVTDDAAAIQDAIDSLDSSGGTVYFPPGKYLVGTQLDISVGGVRLLGGGAMNYITLAGFDYGDGAYLVADGAITLLDIAPTDTNIIQSGPVIENIGFADLSGNDSTLVNVRLTNHGTFRNCLFYGGLVGVVFDSDTDTVPAGDASYWLVDQSVFVNNTTGVKVQGAGGIPSVTVRGGRFNVGDNQVGIDITQVAYFNRVEGVKFDLNTDAIGIRVINGGGTAIVGCMFEMIAGETGGTAITLAPTAAPEHVKGTTITGCFVYGGDVHGTGISMDGVAAAKAEYATVTGCGFRNLTTAVSLGANSNKCSLVNLSVTACTTGISVVAGANQNRIMNVVADITLANLLSDAGTNTSAGMLIASDTYAHLLFSGGRAIQVQAGTPEGSLTAPVGSLCLRTDGGTSTTLYVKESGTGNTGWAAK